MMLRAGNSGSGVEISVCPKNGISKESAINRRDRCSDKSSNEVTVKIVSRCRSSKSSKHELSSVSDNLPKTFLM